MPGFDKEILRLKTAFRPSHGPTVNSPVQILSAKTTFRSLAAAASRFATGAFAPVGHRAYAMA